MTGQDQAAALIHALCQHFDVTPERVRQVRITPGSIEPDVFAVNDQGHKFIDGSGKAAVDTRSLPFDSTRIPA